MEHALITLILPALLGILGYVIGKAIDWIRSSYISKSEKTDKQIEKTRERTDDDLEKFENKIERKFEKIERDMDQLFGKMENKFDQLVNKMESQSNTLTSYIQNTIHLQDEMRSLKERLLDVMESIPRRRRK